MVRTGLTVRGFVFSVTVERRRAERVGANKKACVGSPAWQALHPQTGALWGCILFSAQRLGGCKLLVGKAGRAVCHMDDAAAGKAVLFQQMLHDLVIGMGVRTQAFLFAPARSALRRSMVTEETKPPTTETVLATNTNRQKNSVGTDPNANL